jgi:hypothetical protein
MKPFRTPEDALCPIRGRAPSHGYAHILNPVQSKESSANDPLFAHPAHQRTSERGSAYERPYLKGRSHARTLTTPVYSGPGDSDAIIQGFFNNSE